MKSKIPAVRNANLRDLGAVLGRYGEVEGLEPGEARERRAFIMGYKDWVKSLSPEDQALLEEADFVKGMTPRLISMRGKKNRGPVEKRNLEGFVRALDQLAKLALECQEPQATKGGE